MIWCSRFEARLARSPFQPVDELASLTAACKRTADVPAFKTELELMRALSHENLLRIYTSYVKPPTPCLVTDREKQIGGSGGSLEPPGPLLEPPGPLLTHLHTVYGVF